MQSNRRQLNTNTSELLWCATARRQHQLPKCPSRILPDTIILSPGVRDLGISIYTDLSMQTHIQRSVAGCFAVLRQLHSIRRSVPSSVYQSLVVLLYWHSWIMVTWHWLASRPACLTVSSLYSVRQLGPSLSSLLGAYYRCSCQFSLARITGVHQVQTSGHCLPSSSRHCTSVLVRPVAVRRWSVDKTSRPAALVDLQSCRRPPVAACHCWRWIFCCCWPTTLEQSTCRRPVCPITHNMSSETENTFTLAVIPRHCSVAASP